MSGDDLREKLEEAEKRAEVDAIIYGQERLAMCRKEVDDLRTKLAAAEHERDNWRQIVIENCDADAEFRKEAGDLDQSDCYSGDRHTEILQRCKALLSTAQAKLDNTRSK